MATFLGLDFVCERAIGKPFAELPLYVPRSASPLGLALADIGSSAGDASGSTRRRAGSRATAGKLRPKERMLAYSTDQSIFMARQMSREGDIAAVQGGTIGLLKRMASNESASSSVSDRNHGMDGENDPGRDSGVHWSSTRTRGGQIELPAWVIAAAKTSLSSADRSLGNMEASRRGWLSACVGLAPRFCDLAHMWTVMLVPGWGHLWGRQETLLDSIMYDAAATPQGTRRLKEHIEALRKLLAQAYTSGDYESGAINQE